MIDLQEPVRRSYTREEEEVVRKNFLILLHSFLLLYLSLHNLFIPLALNALKGREILQDVHYWFLFHLPLHFWLRKGKMISSSYNTFLVVGSLARLVFYSVFMFTKSWTIVSVFLSEVSSLIFSFVIWNMASKDRYLYVALLGVLIPPYLASVEKYPPDAGPRKISRAITIENYKILGCQGSEILLSTQDLADRKISSRAKINGCGFDNNLYSYRTSFELFNGSGIDHNLRLYELKKKEGRVSWKFLKMIRLQQNTTVDLGKDLKTKTMYLLKSPERRQVGMMLLIPEVTEVTGKFEINYDSIHWSKK